MGRIWLDMFGYVWMFAKHIQPYRTHKKISYSFLTMAATDPLRHLRFSTARRVDKPSILSFALTSISSTQYSNVTANCAGGIMIGTASGIR